MSYAETKIEEYDAELREQLKLNRMNVESRIQESSGWQANWLRKYANCREDIRKLEIEELNLEEALFKSVKNEYPQLSDRAIGLAVDKKPNMRKIKDMINQNKIILNWLEGVLNLYSFTFVKKIDKQMEYIKFISGD
jgi:predicted nuclease with TOPRIM domain